MKKLSENATKLQVLQNDMLRVILGIDIRKHVNMKKIRENIKMMSMNQLSCYHTLLEAYNIIRNSSSKQIKRKWDDKIEHDHFLRSEKRNDPLIPERPMKSCEGFTYNGAKLFSKLPCNIKEISNPNTFKFRMRNWIWENILSY